MGFLKRAKVGWVAVGMMCSALVCACTLLEGPTPTASSQPIVAVSTSEPTSEETESATPERDYILPEIEEPLNEYRVFAWKFRLTLWAQQVVVSDCMDRFGFDYAVTIQDRAHAEELERRFLSMKYGITSASDARKWGYAMVSDPARPEGPQTGRNNQAERSEAYILVYEGSTDGRSVDADAESPGQVGGMVIPPGGCLGEARTKIYGSPATAVDTGALGLELAYQAGSASLQDPRLVEVRQAWVDCMGEAGYRRYVNSTEDAQKRRWDAEYATPATDDEIQEALADISCKKKVDFVQTMNRVQVEYQKDLIEENLLALQAEKERIGRIVDNAEEILRGKL